MTNLSELTGPQVEAVRTLKPLIDVSAEEVAEKSLSAAVLVHSLAALHDVVGFVVNAQQHYTALLFSQTKQAIFRISKEGDVVLTDASRIVIPLAIEYDRIAKKWLGTEIDPNLVPVPGQPYPRKEPLVALAEAVVKAINTVRPTSSLPTK
ncbi:MAG: hypothetical protein ABW061_17140 [Polyangiaceae bacterium]